VDDESKAFGENMAKMLCAVALGMVPFLTLMIDDQMEQLFAGIRCFCVRNGEVRLDGEGVAKRVACRYLLEDKGIPLVPLPDRSPPCDREWRGFAGRGGAARGEGYP